MTTALPGLVSEIEARFVLLDAELTQAGVEVELCLVGGAMLPLAFVSRPETRRPRQLFAPREALDHAAAVVRDRVGLGPDWLEESVRAHVGAVGKSGGLFEGAALRVYEARAEYVLAMRCAALAFPPDPVTEREARADLPYLLRYLGLRTPGDAIAALEPYLNERQRPEDLPAVLQLVLGKSG